MDTAQFVVALGFSPEARFALALLVLVPCLALVCAALCHGGVPQGDRHGSDDDRDDRLADAAAADLVRDARARCAAELRERAAVAPVSRVRVPDAGLGSGGPRVRRGHATVDPWLVATGYGRVVPPAPDGVSGYDTVRLETHRAERQA